MKGRKAAEPQALPVTTARAQLFDLVEDLLTGRSSRIELSHRDHAERVVLMRKAEIEGMEADLHALRSRAGPQPRPLRGLGTLNVRPEETLSRTRARQEQMAAEKRASVRETSDAAGNRE